MDMSDPQAVGLAFAQIVTGTTIAEGPPPPDSPLGRVLAFTAKYGDEALTPDHIAAAREGRPLLP
jgi:hypothetical protein